MTVNLDGDVVIVTGGAGGLGRAYCKLLAGLGARVVVNDTGGVVDGTGGDPDAAASVVHEIEAAGGVAVADIGDGSKVVDAKALVTKAVETFGRIDAVIANAGILRDKSFRKLSDDDFVAVIDAHLYGTFRVFHAAYPHLHKQGYGRLVATTSASGLFGNFGQTSYAAAKLAIVGLCNSLAQEGATCGVKVNVIAPAARSRMTEHMMPPDVGHLMTPDAIAPLAAYLVSRRCAVNGHVISAAGGRFARVRVGVNPGTFLPSVDPDAVGECIEAFDEADDVVFPTTAFEEVGLLAQVAGHAAR